MIFVSAEDHLEVIWQPKAAQYLLWNLVITALSEMIPCCLPSHPLHLNQLLVQPTGPAGGQGRQALSVNDVFWGWAARAFTFQALRAGESHRTAIWEVRALNFTYSRRLPILPRGRQQLGHALET